MSSLNSGVRSRWTGLRHLLLRTEGLSSSQIEGVRASLAEVVLAGQHPSSAAPDARLIIGNLSAIEDAVASAASPITLSTLLRWHKLLMQRSDTLPASMVGTLRTSQGWIGGTSPLSAAYVPPPPEYVPSLTDDLVDFLNEDAVDPVTQAATAHAQFEAIHPFGDGNGRVGRALIHWVLVRRLGIVVPPPLSTTIWRDRAGYLSGLTLFRLGDSDPWVSWFADVLVRSSQASADLMQAISDEVGEWTGALADLRSDAAARRLLPQLPALLVMSPTIVADRLGVSRPAARSALEVLERRGILQRVEVSVQRPGRPEQWWEARWLLDKVTDWSA